MRVVSRIFSCGLIAMLPAVMAVGCQGGRSATSMHTGDMQRDRAVVSSLVTVPDDSALASARSGWEANRNDQAEPAEATPDRARRTYVEIQHREQLRTSSGRPREHTTTRTRVIQRRGQRR